MSKFAGPWISVGGGGSVRDARVDIAQGFPDAFTLATEYPTCVYVRTALDDEWRTVKTRAEADAVLRAAGWELQDAIPVRESS